MAWHLQDDARRGPREPLKRVNEDLGEHFSIVDRNELEGRPQRVVALFPGQGPDEEVGVHEGRELTQLPTVLDYLVDVHSHERRPVSGSKVQVCPSSTMAVSASTGAFAPRMPMSFPSLLNVVHPLPPRSHTSW